MENYTWPVLDGSEVFNEIHSYNTYFGYIDNETGTSLNIQNGRNYNRLIVRGLNLACGVLVRRYIKYKVYVVNYDKKTNLRGFYVFLS